MTDLQVGAILCNSRGRFYLTTFHCRELRYSFLFSSLCFC